jgi:hypothetical protein
MPTDDEIRFRAHQLCEEAGKLERRKREFWYQAEQELQHNELSTISRKALSIKLRPRTLRFLARR